MSTVYTVQQILNHWHQPSAHPQVNHVVRQLQHCRTAKLGYHLYQCIAEDCNKYHYQYHSCRNRHCPQCGGLQKQQWIEDRTAELLPAHYYHVVFTLPHELNSLILGNRVMLFKLLFEAAARTLLTFAADKKYLGATPGILAILHTWGQQLSFHPHVHCIVSSGGLYSSGKSTRWKNAVRNSRHFIFPVKALSKVFRAKFIDGIRHLDQKQQLAVADVHGLYPLLQELRKKDWVVYAKKPWGGPAQVISYLGRYTHRTAITNERIKMINETAQTVSFSYKDYADNSSHKIMTLSAIEFVRRFEQHILPKGFTRIRSYGYLANRGKTAILQTIRRMMKLLPLPPKIQIPWQVRLLIQQGAAQLKCPCCGRQSMVLRACSFKLADDG